jgi:hypothetical protein
MSYKFVGLSSSFAKRATARKIFLSAAYRYGSHSHHGPSVPPFARLRPPTESLPEQVELVWDDSVAPETCIDFDAPHVSTKEVLISFFTAFGTIALLFQLIKYLDPEGNSPVVPRSAVISKEIYFKSLGLDFEEENKDDESEEIE